MRTVHSYDLRIVAGQRPPPRQFERPLRIVEPPFGPGCRAAVPDPFLSSTVLRTGHRNRLKPPFNLPHRGIPTFSEWMPTTEGRIAPARGPPLWAAADAEHNPAADPLLQSVPAFEFDQRLTW